MWDPNKYLAFADHRARPFFDLVSRIRADQPRRVTDLGCGPGNLTVSLRDRWPDAELEAVDSSPDMVQAARRRDLPARVLDVADWQPASDTDVVITNAVLQWVPGHAELLARWLPALPPGAWFAMQVPGNFDAPSHQVIRELATEPAWRSAVGAAVLREADVVHTPARYAEILSDAGADVDVWETTYLHRLSGPDPVLEWVSGTALRPVRAALDDAAWQEFRAALAPRLAATYPVRPDGTTWLPFRRIFAVANRR